MRRLLKSAFFVLAILYIPVRSMGWGQNGHRIVGAIAETYLSPAAKAAVHRILGTESLAISSTWADFIKADTAYKYLSVWHYADFAAGLDNATFRDTLKNDKEIDAWTKLNFLIAQLKNKKLDKEKQRMYLRLLVHIAGDVHQPLHVSPNGDAGGNDIKLTWFGQNSNLHRVWDEQMIEQQALSYTEYTNAINHPTAAQLSQWQHEPMSQWFYDSYSLSEKLRTDLNGNTKLGYEYTYNHLQSLNTQLLKGGIHLAALLNNIFK